MESTTIKETMATIVGSVMGKLKNASNLFLFVLMVGLILVLGANIV